MKCLSPWQQLLNWSFYFWSKSSICWHLHLSLLPEFHTKSPLKRHTVWLMFPEIWVSMLLETQNHFFFCWKYMKYMVEYMIRKDHAIILSKLSYKGKVRLKELQKILRSFRFHFMKFAWKLPKQTQQLTTEYCWSSVLNLKL